MKNVMALGVLALCAVQPALAEEDCRLQIAASLPLTFEASGHVSVPAAIGERAVNLLVDTGGVMALREDIANELHLKTERLKTWQRAELFGGFRMHDTTVVKAFTLGKLQADGLTFLIVPDEERLKGFPDGLLGQNVLVKYDVDFDFAGAKLRLFLPHRCPGRVVYWTQDESLIAKLPMDFHGGDIRLPVTVDGVAVNAILDTGAEDTVMDLETYMPKFGLTPDSPGMERVGEPDDPHPRYVYRLKTLTFGGVTVNNPRVVFVSQAYAHNPDYKMLVGIDILRQLHLYIAYQEKMLYITSATAH